MIKVLAAASNRIKYDDLLSWRNNGASVRVVKVYAKQQRSMDTIYKVTGMSVILNKNDGSKPKRYSVDLPTKFNRIPSRDSIDARNKIYEIIGNDLSIYSIDNTEKVISIEDLQQVPVTKHWQDTK